jgi:hypothetical protein
MELDGDSPLPFQLIRIQYLGPHLSLLKRTRTLQQPVGQGGFPMVDMGDDGKIPDVLCFHEMQTSLGKSLGKTAFEYNQGPQK